MKHSGAEITIKLLERQGISVISGIPGGANLPLYNALYKSTIKHVLARHEQGSGFIAQGMARSSGKAAVCFATSGPGVVNLLTAIADAKLDSVPVVAITGQVNYSLIGTDAFQEIDTYGLTIPITKHNFLVRSAKELLEVIPEAFRIAESGRPGPVVVDIPKDVQTEEWEFEEWPEIGKKTEVEVNDNDLSNIQKACQLINNSKKPVIYAGGGVVNSEASNIVYELATKNSIPVTSTLMGLGCFPPDHKQYIGMLGMHGAIYTNKILHEADLILALGVRFDDRATGKVIDFCPNATIIHIDIDESEIDKIKSSNLSIGGDAGKIIEEMLPNINRDTRNEWITFVDQMKIEFPFVLPKENPYHPIYFIKSISNYAPADAIITTDVGQHQMWTAQSYPFKKPRTFLTSGGLGTMGFGLPAAIGAGLQNPDKRIICISGDGSFHMNIQELSTLKDLNLNVTIFLMNNGHLGLVRQQQELFYNGNYIASKFDTSPDFAAISRAFGIRSFDLNGISNPLPIIKSALSENGPCLVNVPVDPSLNVMPMVPPGKANYEAIGG